MTNYTEIPQGIIILNYSNFISVDLDVRETVLIDELENSIILCDFGWQIGDKKIRKNIKCKLLPPRPTWYKTLRLIHRCAIKYLCQKDEVVSELIKDIIKGTENLCDIVLDKNESVASILKNSLFEFENRYKIEPDIINLFHRLFKFM